MAKPGDNAGELSETQAPELDIESLFQTLNIPQRLGNQFARKIILPRQF